MTWEVEVPNLSPLIDSYVAAMVKMDEETIDLQIKAGRKITWAQMESQEAIASTNLAAAEMVKDMSEEMRFKSSTIKKLAKAKGLSDAEADEAVRVVASEQLDRIAERSPALKSYLESISGETKGQKVPKKTDWISSEEWSKMSSKERGKIIAARKKGKQGS